MTSESRVKVTIEGVGMSFSREVDVELAPRIIAICVGQDDKAHEALKRTPDFPSLSSLQGRRKDSVAEYVSRFTLRRHPDKILALAGYVKEVLGRESFQAGEIKSLFREAGEISPANFSRDFRWVQNSGWIANDPQLKGTYFITNTGMKVLQEGFPKEMIERSKFRSEGRRKRSRGKGGKNE